MKRTSYNEEKRGRLPHRPPLFKTTLKQQMYLRIELQKYNKNSNKC